MPIYVCVCVCMCVYRPQGRGDAKRLEVVVGDRAHEHMFLQARIAERRPIGDYRRSRCVCVRQVTLCVRATGHAVCACNRSCCVRASLGPGCVHSCIGRYDLR